MHRDITKSFLYLTAIRPNIMLRVGLCARLQSNPKESHLKAAKRMLRYLKGTQDLVLYYPSGDNFDLIGYANVDYSGYLGTRKQNSMTLSTVEAEYVVTASCCAQLLWIRQQLEDFRVFSDCVSLLCDNTNAFNMEKTLVQLKRTKNIDVRHQFLRDSVEKGLICMKLYRTEDQIADLFTIALSREHFEQNHLALRLIKPN
ncbi:secreted RxLR effector protein 161-like [Nicotiana tabacum]|uniref:Secreted RxLR effector protein 161-like n=1 Tax=Nicotiana tabacum TaxID=4097 RepID=A0AC58S5U8_TOBAC